MSTPAWSITTALVAEGVGKSGGKEDVHGCEICGRCVQVTFYCISESNCGIRGCDSVFFSLVIFSTCFFVNALRTLWDSRPAPAPIAELNVPTLCRHRRAILILVDDFLAH